MLSKVFKKGIYGMSVIINIEVNKYLIKYKKYVCIKILDVNYYRRVYRLMYLIYGLIRYNKMFGGLFLRRIWRCFFW